MIHGLYAPRLAEGGKIKCGGLGETKKSKDGRDYRVPMKLDHFIITKATERDEAGDLVEDAEVMAALPKDPDGKIRALPILLHSNVIEEVFPTTLAMYQGKKLYCSGDGKTAKRWRITKEGKRTGESKEIACPCDFLKDRQCRPHGTLHCSIVAPGHSIAGAVHRWRTTSQISISRMLASLNQVLGVIGSLRDVPMWLVLQPVKVDTGTVYCCHVEVRESDIGAAQRHVLEMRRVRAIVGADAPVVDVQPPAGDDEPADEQGDAQQEFHPEAPPAGEVVDKATGEVFQPAPEPSAPEEEKPWAPQQDREPPPRGADPVAAGSSPEALGHRQPPMSEGEKARAVEREKSAPAPPAAPEPVAPAPAASPTPKAGAASVVQEIRDGLKVLAATAKQEVNAFADMFVRNAVAGHRRFYEFLPAGKEIGLAGIAFFPEGVIEHLAGKVKIALAAQSRTVEEELAGSAAGRVVPGSGIGKPPPPGHDF